MNRPLVITATFIVDISLAAVADRLRESAPEKPALQLVPLNATGRLPPPWMAGGIWRPWT